MPDDRSFNNQKACWIGQIIEGAINAKGFTQKQVADYVGVSDRTVRYWIDGEHMPDSKYREKLVILLDIDPVLLDLTQMPDLSPKLAYDEIRSIESMVDQANFVFAGKKTDLLLAKLTKQFVQGDESILIPLISSEYLAAHVTSIIGEGKYAPVLALEHLQKMKMYIERLDLQPYYARRQTFLCLSYTYQAEMYRRLKRRGVKSVHGIAIDNDLILSTFGAAPLDLHVDTAVRGNHAQLLGRAYAMMGNNVLAEQQLQRAEHIAIHANKQNSSPYVCFNPCSVYEEWAQYYRQRGEFKIGLEFIEKAEKYVPQAPRWKIPVKLTKSKLYITRVVNFEGIDPSALLKNQEFQTGLEELQDAVKLATKAGHQRQIRLAEHFSKKLSEQSTKSALAGQMVSDVIGQNMHQA